MKNRRMISLPGLHDLNFSSIEPLLDRPELQRLRGIKQLGPSLVHVGSNHTRLEHSLYAYSITQERVHRWIEDGSIAEEEGRALELYAFLHDVGHSAYSHAIEKLCVQDHNEYGLMIFRTLKHEIEQCGGNMKLLIDMMSRKNPLHACVSDRPLGTDKLAYLLLDSRNTTEQVGMRIGSLLNHVSFTGTSLAIDTTITSETLALRRAYVDMYIDVYYRKASIIAQTFLEQMVDRAIHTGSVRQDKLQTMDDSELDGELRNSEDSIVRQWFDDFKKKESAKGCYRNSTFRRSSYHS